MIVTSDSSAPTEGCQGDAGVIGSSMPRIVLVLIGIAVMAYVLTLLYWNYLDMKAILA